MSVSESQPDKPFTQFFTNLRLRTEAAQVIFALILLLAAISRFYALGERVMSHDETQHTYFSWAFYKGSGYTHTPLTHGPLQFHLMALSYTLFGDSDAAARVPHALASVAAVAFLWFYRRYLGKTGMLVAAALMVISPFQLYYGRYARNESLVLLFGLVTLWAMLRYFESGRARYIYALTLASALHFTAKETAFIYTAQLLLFLGLLFLERAYRAPWRMPDYRKYFLGMAVIAVFFLGAALTLGTLQAGGEPADVPAVFLPMAAGIGALAGAIGIYLLVRGFGIETLRRERSFDLIVVLGTLVLPQLAPFLIKLAGLDPLDYSYAGMLRSSLFIIPMAVLAVIVGLWWNRRQWLINTGIFYGIFTVFYTTMFTYGAGFFTGLVASLGYWLAQQGVERGSQPWYYYLLIQVPIYEYLPFLGSLLALALAFVRGRRVEYQVDGDSGSAQPDSGDAESSPRADTTAALDEGETDYSPYAFQPAPLLALLTFWSVTSILAYTVAGEKMPWLTVHISWPLILLAAWGLGHLIDGIEWRRFLNWRMALVLVLLPLFAGSVRDGQLLLRKSLDPAAMRATDLPGLVATGLFFLIAAWLLLRLVIDWAPGQFGQAALVAVFALLGVMTARTAYQASFIHFDQATEFLVYAHSAPANKLVYNQVEELSKRLYGDLSIKIAYDNTDGEKDPGAAWPTTWYYRNFPNTRAFGPEAPRDLTDYPVIIVSDVNWNNVEPVLRNQYESFEYIRMWWPTQDYFDLTQERIRGALATPQMWSALYHIWRDRDYTLYASLLGKDMSLPNWSPDRKMRVYLRKDLSALVWNYGSEAVKISMPGDPYAEGKSEIPAALELGSQGGLPGQFQMPRNLAVAPDGSVYVADTQNHRIQHLSAEGDFLGEWGQFGTAGPGETAAPGSFNEPWSVAVSQDGSVYVADTWNHRIQKFDPQGNFLLEWGYFGTAERPEAFWGPRDVAVDSQGRIYVVDTGNKRIVLFDLNGQPLTQVTADFSEPVGIALDESGRLYVADTWNRRILVLEESQPGQFQAVDEFPIEGWYGESLDNKPYLALSGDSLFISDPEGYRILQFSTGGEFVRTWGDFGSGLSQLMLPNGLAADAQGGLWVADAGNHRLSYFVLP